MNNPVLFLCCLSVVLLALMLVIARCGAPVQEKPKQKRGWIPPASPRPRRRRFIDDVEDEWTPMDYIFAMELMDEEEEDDNDDDEDEDDRESDGYRYSMYHSWDDDPEEDAEDDDDLSMYDDFSNDKDDYSRYDMYDDKY